MTEERQQSWWKRAATVVGLISVLCFWTAVAAHVHDAARQGSVRQECQLCIAGTSSQTLLINAPVAIAFLLLLSRVVLSVKRPHIAQPHHLSPPRSPPTLS